MPRVSTAMTVTPGRSRPDWPPCSAARIECPFNIGILRQNIRNGAARPRAVRSKVGAKSPSDQQSEGGHSEIDPKQWVAGWRWHSWNSAGQLRRCWHGQANPDDCDALALAFAPT